MTAQYPCDFIGTAQALCGNLAIAVRGPYDYPKSLRSSCDFLFQNDHLKSCFPTRSPCGRSARTVIVRVYRLTIFIFVYYAELNKTVEATEPYGAHETVRYRTASIRRLHENGILGIVRALQAHRRPNVN